MQRSAISRAAEKRRYAALNSVPADRLNGKAILEQCGLSKTKIQQNVIPVFGIAESKFLESEPKGYRPSDLLSSASRVLCFGTQVPRGVLLDQKRVNENYWRIASVYYHNI
ncbi:hypothetical protein MHK_008022 [Candidatus Magnetomorum sp. HK-1]|nr:hypothetical protein MHK_008022 [Candidatus Magnetomorum sp. HK-1]